jgi:O-antigen/teichoic acid export membrane protein
LTKLKKNIIASYASQLYVIGVGVLILPLYIKYMGAEAYGLVGFFTMLQSWFGLLDMGLTPTIGRETARYHGGSMSALAYRQLFRALSLIFLAVAVAGGSSLFMLADLVTQQWLHIESLDMNTVVLAVQIMAISVALRWMCGLYRGVITGSERLVWLSSFNVLVATLRFIVVFLSMWKFGFTPLVFFIHQLIVALIELAGLFWKSSRLLPSKVSLEDKIGWSFQPVKPVLKFALTIAFTSSIWVLVTQTDKLILSGILPLSEYGYFTLAVLVASGIMVISSPISSAIMPRMARLNAEGKHDEMIQVYRNATQLVSVVAGSASLTIAFFAEPLLYAWTGDREIASNAAPILTLYALGNGVLAVSAFPYYLQYALGNLRYHLIGNLVTVVTLIPAIIWAASEYGGVGAGWAWLGINSLYLILWVGYVHHKLQPGVHVGWLVKDIAGIYAPVILLLFLASAYMSYQTRQEAFIGLIVFSFCAIFIATVSSSVARKEINRKLFGVKL